MVAEVTLELKHNMEVQEVHTVEVMAKSGGDSDFAMTGLCNPSWTYMH